MTAKTLSELAQLCGAALEGDGAREISGPASLMEATSSEISFLANPKYRSQLETTSAGAVVVARDVEASRDGLSLLRCEDPNRAFSAVVEAFSAETPDFEAGIHPTAVVGADCELPDDVTLGANCVIGDGVKFGPRAIVRPGTVIGPGCVIGADTLIHSNVTIYALTEIGERCVIHGGAVIGAEGFGFDPSPQGWVKVPQCGNVILEDGVEIGANTTIDRARFGSTRIRRGAKLDNQVQVGHNVEIGENVLLVAQVGLAGSSEIGEWSVLGGQAGVAGHSVVGPRARIAGKSAVIGDLPGNADYMGFPARPHKEALKRMAAAGRVEKLAGRIEALEKKLEQYEGGSR